LIGHVTSFFVAFEDMSVHVNGVSFKNTLGERVVVSSIAIVLGASASCIGAPTMGGIPSKASALVSSSAGCGLYGGGVGGHGA
jgi:hypothetical protein